MGSAGTITVDRLGEPGEITLLGKELVIYVLNVGDGDSIVIQFPKPNDGERNYAVVDSNDGGKTLALLNDLGVRDLRFVCATHPHIDHFRGLRQVLDEFKGNVQEFWDSGFRYTAETYKNLLAEVGRQAGNLRLVRPTAGYEHFVERVRVTVLSPSVALRNRFDTYGVDINNASVVIRLEYPVPDPIDDFATPPKKAPDDLLNPDGGAEPVKRDARVRAVILGGDAQTDAWAQVVSDFPTLLRDKRSPTREITETKRRQPLLCDVLKVSHHASKHGINLELLERMGDTGSGSSDGPGYMLVSCASDDDSDHGFPHVVAQALMREVRDPQAKGGQTHKPDDVLGIHYTSQCVANEADSAEAAGSIAVVLHDDGRQPVLYRFGDSVSARVNLNAARRVVG